MALTLKGYTAISDLTGIAIPLEGVVTEAQDGLSFTIDLTKLSYSIRIIFATKDAKVYRFPIGRAVAHKNTPLTLVYAQGQLQK